MIRLISTSVQASPYVSGPLAGLGMSPASIDQVLALTSVQMVVTTCAKAGNRNPRVAILDASSNHCLDLAWVPVQAASTTRTYQAIQFAALSAAFVQNAAQCPMPQTLLPFGYIISSYDDSAIAANYDAGRATAATATTLTNTDASWTVNGWTGYTAHMGLDLTLVVTSNSATALTGTGGWSDLVAGTAEDSDATSMTDSDATWTTNTLVGLTVSMGGSTATVLSNTDTVATIDGWAPAGPTTGAYTIYGPYSIVGDMATLTTTANTLERVDI